MLSSGFCLCDDAGDSNLIIRMMMMMMVTMLLVVMIRKAVIFNIYDFNGVF